ncbi:gamma-glutamylcyclotransferase [Leptolyngbya sp. PCC 6406]|uniref:gamma-glutamylcyclotransferase family protein n=1 Tax=Leptolyngbya sp. PCC 6406 TaxID=1173264 RepID=UPI0002AC2A98|nr:gamma-glutamylcyclotransferase family protein [Leptolyngbya sp. PCC 6406]
MHQVFVYGTLKPGEAFHDRYCAPYLEATCPAQVQGRLYHLPQGYPALTDEPGWVTGTLLTLMDGAVLGMLDEFEEYDPTRSQLENLYIRLQRPVFTPEGADLGTAWMYVMATEQVERCQGIWIPTGVWNQTTWPTISPKQGGN